MSEPTAAQAAHGGRGLVVAPFRGLRFDAARVPDLAAVTSPPYDVIDADGATQLEQLDPHNVVRLILPREEAEDARGRYEHAASRLRSWQESGILLRDTEAALYVYEQSTTMLLQRGLMAAVELRGPDERVILPHEDVMPGPVADRLELMRATAANLEPILLVYEGGGPAADVIEGVVSTTAPLLDTTTDDGLRHRLWAVTDPDLQHRVAGDLADRQALIADGHHRYATYRRLQAEHRGPGPWDRGLALLVDSRRYPLQVQAIHRVVEGLPLEEARRLASSVFTEEAAPPDPTGALAALVASPARHPFLLTDGTEFVLLGDPEPAAVAGALPPLHSATWRSLDASVLHCLLLERLWGIEDGSESVRYVHAADAAVQTAARSGGTAVLLRPVRVEQVMEVSATGERMPRKSTSFGPKPRTGLVLRLLDDEDDATVTP